MTVVVALLLIPALLIVVATTIWRAIDWIRGNHERAAENTRDAAKGALVVSKLAVFWSWLVAPTGMTAVATAIGVTSTPLIVLATPVVVAIAGATATVATALELYSKWRKRRV
ncbi:hypothetical protein NYO99_21285 [Pelomonas sp. UHG3]|uniref:Uncharacterized protein n=1 Tax=Roseateles hydrophilus TaxID=2975054 RepID=A0ACC6CGD4_9BURK|nr:hypothetical protein [Pelomonas sp. UHG3]MCY4747513.1 hypothetical protein [Pelomonas sp. UHG3]